MKINKSSPNDMLMNHTAKARIILQVIILHLLGGVNSSVLFLTQLLENLLKINESTC